MNDRFTTILAELTKLSGDLVVIFLVISADVVAGVAHGAIPCGKLTFSSSHNLVKRAELS